MILLHQDNPLHYTGPYSALGPPAKFLPFLDLSPAPAPGLAYLPLADEGLLAQTPYNLSVASKKQREKETGRREVGWSGVQ